MTTDKRTTLDEAVAGLRSGMTIGIGGWGSRRKPMAFVRAMLRTEVTDADGKPIMTTMVTMFGESAGAAEDNAQVAAIAAAALGRQR